MIVTSCDPSVMPWTLKISKVPTHVFHLCHKWLQVRNNQIDTIISRGKQVGLIAIHYLVMILPIGKK